MRSGVSLFRTPLTRDIPIFVCQFEFDDDEIAESADIDPEIKNKPKFIPRGGYDYVDRSWPDAKESCEESGS